MRESFKRILASFKSFKTPWNKENSLYTNSIQVNLFTWSSFYCFRICSQLKIDKKFILHHSSEIMIRLHYHFFTTPKGKKCSIRNKVSCWNIYDQITHLSPHTCFRKVLIKRISWKLASLFDRRLTNAKRFLIKIRFEQMLEPLSDEQVWLWGIAKEPKCSQHRWNLKRCRLLFVFTFPLLTSRIIINCLSSGGSIRPWIKKQSFCQWRWNCKRKSLFQLWKSLDGPFSSSSSLLWGHS